LLLEDDLIWLHLMLMEKLLAGDLKLLLLV
jgi:hypothetical protein